jgi:hypothetical protein
MRNKKGSELENNNLGGGGSTDQANLIQRMFVCAVDP